MTKRNAKDWREKREIRDNRKKVKGRHPPEERLGEDIILLGRNEKLCQKSQKENEGRKREQIRFKIKSSGPRLWCAKTRRSFRTKGGEGESGEGGKETPSGCEGPAIYEFLMKKTNGERPKIERRGG